MFALIICAKLRKKKRKRTRRIMKSVIVIGGGLAGVEATYQLIKDNIPVTLYEMRPIKTTEAHKTAYLGELVCSNSFRGSSLANGVGLLKEEMRQLGTLFMESALKAAIPAGAALAVNRDQFSSYLTKTIKDHPLVTIIEEEITTIPFNQPVIVATGPLTSGSLFKYLQTLTGESYCYFFDGSAPIISADSIDYSKIFFANRYGKGSGDDYLNCPMTREMYDAFYEQLITEERAVPHLNSEKELYFDGCMPIEVMAKIGKRTLLFGPFKPVGLNHPVTGKSYYAVIQLRAENNEKTMYNLVGCQTGLKFGSQKKLVQMIPGLENVEILRYGVVHRNSYLNGPKVLTLSGQLKSYPNIFIAGQLSGVEGYVESASSGYLAGRYIKDYIANRPIRTFPRETMIGALSYYLTEGTSKYFQPMNANFGLLPNLKEKISDKKIKKERMVKRSLKALFAFI